MLRNLNDLEGYAILAVDGAIGDVKDFYIDDESWAVRYLVVETGNWFASRKVLISPISLGQADASERKLSSSITRDQVRNSPGIDTEKPVSRQHEIDYLGYYAYPLYWGGSGLWGNSTHPNMMMPDFVSTPSVVTPQMDDILGAGAPAIRHHADDSHLRSCNTMSSYHVHATDGEIGHVQGLLVDDATWAIRYIVVNTSNWWLGHQVIIAPEWIDDVSWSDGLVSLNLTQQKVKDAPPFDSAFRVDRMHEVSVYKHYGTMAYWEKEQLPDWLRAIAPQ